MTIMVMLIFPSSAFASRSHVGQLSGLEGVGDIAVDAANHVWASSGGVIEEYGAYPSTEKIGEQMGGGHFCGGEHQLAVDDSTGYLYVAGPSCGEIEVFEGTGQFIERWPVTGRRFRDDEEEIGLAVDNSGGPANGRIYATGGENIKAYEPNGEPANFSASASYISGNEITGTPTIPQFYDDFPRIGEGCFCVAVDSSGDIYVADSYNGEVHEYRSSGEYVRSIVTPGGPTYIGVDPTNDDILVGASGTVDEYSSSGEFLVALGGPGGPIAVNSNGYVYVGDEIYGPQPTIKYEQVSEPTPTSVTLNATVDPHGGPPITACKFEYGDEGRYNLGKVPCSPAASPPFESPTQVHADISALTPETTYHYRVVIETSGGGTLPGVEQNYTSQHVLGLSTEPPTNLTGTSATLSGSFVGNGEDTHYYFEWGTTDSYGHRTSALPGPMRARPPDRDAHRFHSISLV